MSQEEVRSAMQMARAEEPSSLDVRLNSGQEDGGVALSELLGREDDRFKHSLDRLTLSAALSKLPKRERTIVVLRFYEELTQRQIAQRVGISQMHVSRLLRSALTAPRSVLQAEEATDHDTRP